MYSRSKKFSNVVMSKIFCHGHKLATLFHFQPVNDRVLYIAHCTFHACPVHFIAFAAYVLLPLICCTHCTIYL